jgi:Zinc knuckle
MEPTTNSPPPYQREDQERITNDFNNLQNFAQHRNDMIIYRSDYQIFDNSWRIHKLLDRTKRQLRSNVARMQLTIENTEREQAFLMQKASHYFHILNTPEIQRRMNEPESSRQPIRPNTPIPRLRTVLSPTLIPIPMINLPINETHLHTPEPNEIISPRSSPTSTLTTRRNQSLNRCRRCRRTGHQKRDCPRYQCLRCLQHRPGHYTHECPNNNEGSRENPIDIDENDYYHDYDPDGNLDGER